MVAGLMLKELVDRCSENDMSVEWTDRLTEAVVRSGFSPQYGARPLRRAVQRLCEDSVAEAVLSGFVGEGGTLRIDADKKTGNIVLKNKKGKQLVYEARANQGIEEDAGGAGAYDAAVEAEKDLVTAAKPMAR